jgi:hypothetical protein
LGPGFKYHVVSIAAIFFALTIGLVGGSLFLSPQVVRSQSNLLKSLNIKVSQDIKERDQELEQTRKCLAAAVPLAVSGKLAGRNIAIVLVGDYPDIADGIRDILKRAGATVTTVLTIDRGFARPDDLLVPKLTALHQEDARIPTDRGAMAALVAATLANGDTIKNPVLSVLERGDFVRLDGASDYTLRSDTVVIVAGSRVEGANRISEIDQPLIEALKNHNLTVAMCEPEHAISSDVPGYHLSGIDVGTVDNVDSDMGRLALVFVLRGAKDDYGVKPTAKNDLPPITN